MVGNVLKSYHFVSAETNIRMIQQLQDGWQQPRWLNALVLPVSGLYRTLVALRRFAYRIGVKSVHSASVPVIVVGNVTVGGTGKTPIVIALAKYLKRQGRNPGIIARGYGGNSVDWPRQVTQNDRAEEVGDEPALLARATGLPVVAGPSRIDSVKVLVDQCGCDVVLSDDGFQHFSLKRDLDIVVIDAERKLGNGWCLPAGPLREPSSSLRRAGMIVFNGDVDADLPALSALATNTGFSGKIFLSSVTQAGLYRLSNPEDKIALETLAGKQIRAVAGLGNPERFSRLLNQHKIAHDQHFFPDHHDYRNSDFAFLGDTDIVVMTEKDAVKCTDLALPAETWVLGIEATLPPVCLQAIDRIVRNQTRTQTFSGAA